MASSLPPGYDGYHRPDEAPPRWIGDMKKVSRPPCLGEALRRGLITERTIFMVPG